MKYVRDARIKRGFEIGSDHYLGVKGVVCGLKGIHLADRYIIIKLE
jgi:hypothetical protein